MAWECTLGHRGIGPGICRVAGCSRRFKEVEHFTARSEKRLIEDEISVLDVQAYVDRARAHLKDEVET